MTQRTQRLARRLGGGVAGLALVLTACTDPAQDVPDPADLLFENARVYTFTWDEPSREGEPAADAPIVDGAYEPDAAAVAVRDDRIVFVGGVEAAAAYRGPETRVVDLGGAVLLPGLVDSHTHVAELGKSLEEVDLVGVEAEAEAIERVAARAAETPLGEWILGWGFDEGAWANRYPGLEELSAAVPEHPVVLRGLHGFAVWTNRRALEILEVDADTPSPSGGEIVKDAEGNPTGIFLNAAARQALAAVPEATPEQVEAQLLRGLEAMAEAGYVTVHEAGATVAVVAALERLAAAKRLPIRVVVLLSARDPELLGAWRERGPWSSDDGMLHVRAVKAYYDGALGSRGARLLDDYSDRPGHRGVAGEEYGFDEAAVAAMMAAGFQAGVHAIGDAGNRKVLDFFETTFAETTASRNGRHRVEHAQVVHPDDIPRFVELGLIASMEPPHAVEDKAWAEERLGPERIRGAYAWRTLRRAGVPLIMNSDLPGSDHDIFYGLHAAITRRDKNLEPVGGWYPEEALTAEEAVRSYTVWPAWAAFLETETGVLAPGRWADLTALDLDPLNLGASTPAKLLEGSVVLTVVGGEVRFERKSP